MPRPIDLKLIIRVLKREGFFFVSQRGSHAKYRKRGSPVKTVIIKTTNKVGISRFRALKPKCRTSDILKR